MKEDLFGRMFDLLTQFECVGMDVTDAGLLLSGLEDQLDGEVEDLTKEPQMVTVFLNRYPMYAAILRVARNIIDQQTATLTAAVEAATGILQEEKSNGAAAQSDQESRAFHAGYEAGKEAGKQADAQG